MKYFEIEFSDEHEDTATWICIRGQRKPTIEEATEFCKKDVLMIGKPVSDVIQIDENMAKDCYDFGDVDNWPIFAAL